ncbi:phosphopantetheine-binding protein [Kitasatospora sp. NPDC048545]|uniref:phosphopantetheine-binding protein n=1 Tax=unclassified Kitasatospora TaxID=2633591 RepID=UPI0033C6F0A9
MDRITERILTILQDKFSLDGELTATTAFSDLDLDSLVLLELSVILEREFGARIPEDEMAEAGSVAGLAALISARTAAV